MRYNATMSIICFSSMTPCADYCTLAKGSTLEGAKRTKIGPEQAAKIIADNATVGIKSTLSEMKKGARVGSLQ